MIEQIRAFCQTYPEIPTMIVMGILGLIYVLGQPKRKRPDRKDEGYNPYD